MPNVIEALKERGFIEAITSEEISQLTRKPIKVYCGFDPTADSLHIGNLVQIMTLVHFQDAGHKPIALVGGATGMVGDPSGKSVERNLLSEDQLNYNLDSVKLQLEKFLNFNMGENRAEMVNNYDWFKGIRFLDFIRDVGKHITVNYMMAKDSVQKRLDSGLSFTEFSYQLVQGYDFYWLYKNKNCKLQMGGSDQWGNIVTGTELIRRKDNGEAYALTTPLIKKAEELKELEVAIINKDITEVADAFCDLQYVLSGAILEFGLGDKFKMLFEEVQRSNMSKACSTESEAIKTVQFYLAKDGTECYYKEVEGKWLIYRKNDNKTIKSINYSPADLDKILN